MLFQIYVFDKFSFFYKLICIYRDFFELFNSVYLIENNLVNSKFQIHILNLEKYLKKKTFKV